MSLQQKISDELDDLAVKIVRIAAQSHDEKLQKLAQSYLFTRRMLLKIVELETK